MTKQDERYRLAPVLSNVIEIYAQRQLSLRCVISAPATAGGCDQLNTLADVVFLGPIACRTEKACASECSRLASDRRHDHRGLA